MKYRFIFDIKNMLHVIFIPIIWFFIIALIIHNNINTPIFLEEAISISELSIPPFAAWWSIFLMQFILEDNGSETLFSYPERRYNYGITRILTFTIIYVLCIIIFVITINSMTDKNIFIPLFLQLTAQSIFFSSLGFLSIITLSSVMWAITLVGTYYSIMIFTQGKYIPIFNVFFFNNELLSMDQIFGKLIITIFLAITIFIIAQTLLNKYSSYK